MASYSLHGTGSSLFAALGGQTFAAARLYDTATEFAVQNPDGSKTFFQGTGLVWNAPAGKLTAGTLTRIAHYRDGAFVDSIAGFFMAADRVQTAFESGNAKTAEALLLGRDDFLDARFRAGGIVSAVSLTGYGGNDTIYGGAGDDTLNGGSGDDVIDGGKGDDTLYGSTGLDRLHGGAGDDFIADKDTGTASDYLSGGAGDDIIVSGAGNDLIDAGTGKDAVMAGAGNDTIYGGPDPDVIVYDRPWKELVATYIGADYSIAVKSYDGTDKIFAALRIGCDDGTYVYDVPTARWLKESAKTGYEWLYPEFVRTGTAGNDTIAASTADGSGAVILGNGGNDRLTGGELALGGAGDDTILHADRAYGGDGDDTITGAGFADGGAGDDLIQATPSGKNDLFIGGSGDDVFRFAVAAHPSGSGYSRHGTDTIKDFRLGDDRVDIAFDAGVPLSARDISMTQVGANTVIDYAGGEIVLRNFSSAGVDLDDILL